MVACLPACLPGREMKTDSVTQDASYASTISLSGSDPILMCIMLIIRETNFVFSKKSFTILNNLFAIVHFGVGLSLYLRVLSTNVFYFRWVQWGDAS